MNSEASRTKLLIATATVVVAVGNIIAKSLHKVRPFQGRFLPPPPLCPSLSLTHCLSVIGCKNYEPNVRKSFYSLPLVPLSLSLFITNISLSLSQFGACAINLLGIPTTHISASYRKGINVIRCEQLLWLSWQSRGPKFESSNRTKLALNICLLFFGRMKMKKKSPGMVHLKMLGRY